MAIALDPRRRRKYVLREDRKRPEEEQTWFYLQRPPKNVEAPIFDDIDEHRGAGAERRRHARILAVVQAHLVAVDKDHPLRDSTGAAIVFDGDEAFFDRLSWGQMAELGVAALSDGVEESDVEKSAPSPAAS